MLAYLKDVFSSTCPASFSRYATALTVVTGCGCLVYLTLHNHALPDAASLLGLGAWMTAPYAINKVAAAWGTSTKP